MRTRRNPGETLNRAPRFVAGGMPSDLTKLLSDAAYQAYEARLVQQVKAGPVPKHVAIIMDGNRRFAKEIGLTTIEGHEKGRLKLEEVLDWCLDVDVRILTVYAFSTENLHRDDGEVHHLMTSFAENFRKSGADPRVHKHGIRIRAFGRRDLLPADVQAAIAYAEERTKEYGNYRLNLAVAYGGGPESVDAIPGVFAYATAGEGDRKGPVTAVISRRPVRRAIPAPH